VDRKAFIQMARSARLLIVVDDLRQQLQALIEKKAEP
jgi:hypothetical protein